MDQLCSLVYIITLNTFLFFVVMGIESFSLLFLSSLFNTLANRGNYMYLVTNLQIKIQFEKAKSLPTDCIIV